MKSTYRYKPPAPPDYSIRDAFPSFDDPIYFPESFKKGYAIAWSGGSDSNALLNMAMDVVGGDKSLLYPYVMEFLPNMDYYAYWKSYARKRWGLEVHSYQHWAYSWYVRRGLFQFQADPTFPAIKQVDVENKVRLDSGLEWIGYGYKKMDSLHRRGMMSKWPRGVCMERKIFNPLTDWSHTLVKTYLQANKLRPALYEAYKSPGIDTSPKCMYWLKLYWKIDYRRMIEAFPLAIAQADRWVEHMPVGEHIIVSSPDT
jgi:3'-phosphoadenosine 5'-phosphosulfate sulfotransferase (PAPS reductase)/FAD synthetase